MTSPLKILLVSEYFPPDVKGGGELSAELLASNLAQAGHEVHILTSGPDARPYSPPRGVVMHRTLQAASPTSHVGNFRRLFALPRQIRREVSRLRAEQDFDVIHYLNVVSVLGSLPNMKNQFATINSHQPFCPKGNLFYKEREQCAGCSPMRFVGCLASSDYVGKTRVSLALRMNPLFLGALYHTPFMFRKALKNVLPIAVSSYVLEQLASLGFPGAPIVPNLPPRIPIIKRRTPRKKSKSITILFLGALEKIKGVEMLLQAYACLPVEARSRTTLKIAGSGSLREGLEQHASPQVEFLGQVDPSVAHELIAASDIVVLPSLWPEPLSRVLLEAAFFGKPTVATDVGGNSDIIKKGGGILVAPDSRAFAQALEKLINDAEQRKKLGKSGRNHYLKSFSSEKILGRLESLYARR